MILTFDKVGWFNNIIRSFFGGIDYLIYSLISWIIEGIFNLSNLMIDPTFVQVIYKRIYVIIGIFMVFKLSFSFFKYMVSPDSIADKEQGVGKLITRAIIMLAILILLPVVFFNGDLLGPDRGPILNVLQTGLVKTIPKLILGVTSDDSGGNSVVSEADEYGNKMALMMLRSFYYPAECNEDASSCALTDDGNLSGANSSNISDLKMFNETLLYNSSGTGEYDYQYMWPLTTIAGILLIVIMLGIAVDVAIRTFKLIILQMMAPVPVMTYIDPKSSKDGAFNSWLKTFISTYIDLFIKLATVYLLLLLISKLFSSDAGLFKGGINNVQGFMSRNFVRVFLVIGLFKFAKDAPQFIKDAMGIKGKSGGGIFGGLKGLGTAAAVAGGAITAGAAGIGGAVRNAKASFANAKEANAGKKYSNLRNVGSALGAGFGAFGSSAASIIRGGAQGYKGAGKNGNLLKGIANATATQSGLNKKKYEAAASGSTFGGRMQARAENLFGIDKGDEFKSLSDAASGMKKVRDHARDKGFLNRGLKVGLVEWKDKNGTMHGTDFGVGQHSLFKDSFEMAQREGKDSFSVNGITYDMVSAGNLNKALMDKTADRYLEEKGADDPTIRTEVISINENLKNVSDRTMSDYGLSTISDVTQITDSYQKATGNAGITIAESSEYRRRKANQNAIKKDKK